MRTNSLLGNFEEIETSINPKEEIKRFIEDNYNIYRPEKIKISEEPNENGRYVVDCYANVHIKDFNIISLTNGMFEWGNVAGCFNCGDCHFLKTLEGAPKEVGEDFYCYCCNSLTSLQGAPEKVEWNFNCFGCKSLTSLEGAPKEVGRDFDCSECKSLTSLEGAPKEVGRGFDCSECKSLTSLEGAPKEVGGDFDCYNCGKQFTKEDVRKICNVRRAISMKYNNIGLLYIKYANII